MSTFDESKIKRGSDGQFAEKPAAPEADVDLDPSDAPDDGRENFEPGVLGREASAKHEGSVVALESAESKLAAQLRAVQDERLRHTIAAAVAGADTDHPGGKTIHVHHDDDLVDDHGGYTVVLGGVEDADGEELHDFGGEVQWSSTLGSSAGTGWQADFTSDEYGQVIDMDKVRAWSAQSRQVDETEAVWGSANALSEQARRTSMRAAGKMVRSHVPEGRYLVAVETDYPDTLTFSSIEDAEGNTVYETYETDRAGLPEDFDDRLDSLVRGGGGTGQGWEHAVDNDNSSYDYNLGVYDRARIDLDKLLPQSAHPAIGR